MISSNQFNKLAMEVMICPLETGKGKALRLMHPIEGFSNGFVICFKKMIYLHHFQSGRVCTAETVCAPAGTPGIPLCVSEEPEDCEPEPEDWLPESEDWLPEVEPEPELESEPAGCAG